jgi:multidrug transporter EmrE-like cation transporter
MNSYLWLIIFVILNTLASLCFKESGTSPTHGWQYFMVGNIFGPLSLIFLMLAYGRLNLNIASALAIGGSALVIQVTFWLVYGTHLTPLQWGGIALAIIGAVLAGWGKTTAETPTSNALCPMEEAG